MPAMRKVEGKGSVFSFDVAPQARPRSVHLLFGMPGADTECEVRHLQYVQTSPGVSSFSIAQCDDSDNQVPRLLESAMHVSPQVSYLQHVPRPQVQNTELHKSNRDGSLEAVASIGRRCGKFRLRSLQICALHCEAT